MRVGNPSLRAIGVFCQYSGSYSSSHSNGNVTVAPLAMFVGTAEVGRTPHSRITGRGTDCAIFTPDPFSSHAANSYFPPSSVDL